MKPDQPSAMFQPRFIALLLALVTLMIYLPVLHDSFINYDDDDYVTNNRIVKNGLTPAGIHWAFTTFHAANWHPATWLSHMLDCELFGLNPAAHHFVNALVHSVNAALLFILLLRLTNLAWPSLIVAALFAWHPLHVESVAWISERKDVLSAFFALLTLLSYAKYVKENCRRSFWFALLFFALGLMAKPMLVTLPFVMLLLDYWPLQRFNDSTIQRLLVEKIPFFLLTAISCAVTFFAQRAEAIRTLNQVSLPLRFENAATAIATYLAQIFWPSGLAVFYPMPEKIAPPAIFISAAALIFISALVWLARKRNPCLLVGWLWFFGTLFPVIGLVKVGDAAHADRYTYFPSVGIFIAVVFGVWILLKQPRARKIFIVASLFALVACVALTEHQLRFWRDSETLFRRAIAVTENNAPAHLNLGAALETKGESKGALAEYREALRLDPKQFEADSNIGKLLFTQGKFADALPYCELAVRLKPDRATLRNNLGLTLAGLGRFDEALAQFAEAARLDENYAVPRFQTGRTLLKLGRDAEALPQLFAALQIEPDNLQFLIFTARVLAGDKNPQGRDGEKAFVFASRASQPASSSQPIILDTLAMALAERNHFDEAQKIQRQAIELAGKSNDREDLDAMQQRLELYKNRQPWRESFLATNAPVKN
ncbi:MAG TPA: tetratricopeptide repeat protein [Verrucomicrobiae bacterium]|nr:tetratricopeptide repeat protein [Verrucomicrobiae bacterium]